MDGVVVALFEDTEASMKVGLENGVQLDFNELDETLRDTVGIFEMIDNT